MPVRIQAPLFQIVEWTLLPMLWEMRRDDVCCKSTEGVGFFRGQEVDVS
jgi:hypothetical protein